MADYLDLETGMTRLFPADGMFYHERCLERDGAWSREDRIVNCLSDRSVVELVQQWFSEGSLTVVGVRSGSFSGRRWVLCSHLSILKTSDNPAYAVQWRFPRRLSDTYPRTNDSLVAWGGGRLPGGPQTNLNVHHVIWRFLYRRYNIAGQFRNSEVMLAEMSDPRRLAQDLLGDWSARPDDRVSCPLLPYGQDISHHGASYHNAVGFLRLHDYARGVPLLTDAPWEEPDEGVWYHHPTLAPFPLDNLPYK